MAKQPGERFAHPLKHHLIQLQHNLYISRSDPRYYEKVIRFLDPSSPEAHFRVAQKLSKEGHQTKAIYHYREAMKRYPSDYYFRAASAIRRLEAQQQAPPGQLQAELEPRLPYKPLAIALVLLILFNAVLLLLLMNANSVSRTVSELQGWGVGKEVAYEVAEVPYAIYFAGAVDPKAVEKMMYARALELGQANPGKAIVLYGLAAGGGNADGQTYPLTDQTRSKAAFVEARYDAAHDRTVSIRFLNPLPNIDTSQLNPITAAGANYIRTALVAYKRENGELPTEIDTLRANYPGNYISFIPLEPMSGSSQLVSKLDGSGGWVYDRQAAEAEEQFYPNVYEGGSGAARELTVPYEPFRVIVGKSDHALRLVSGKTTLLEEAVGLGESGSTPKGLFEVGERVREPAGTSPGVYGSAALGLGSIAIHGTRRRESIGRNMSKGCIRLGDEDMLRLYTMAPRGTVVAIGETLPKPGRDGETGDIPGGKLPMKDLVDIGMMIPSNVRFNDENAQGVVFHWLN